MIFIGSDHAGFYMKESVKTHLTQMGMSFNDMGTFSIDSCDYVLIAEKVSNEVIKQGDNFGFLFCGTGIGMAIAANKIKGVRAACCSDCFSVRMTREHNNANILCLGGRVVGTGLAFDLIDVFLRTKFCEEEKHQRRIDQISKLEIK